MWPHAAQKLRWWLSVVMNESHLPSVLWPACKVHLGSLNRVQMKDSLSDNIMQRFRCNYCVCPEPKRLVFHLKSSFLIFPHPLSLFFRRSSKHKAPSPPPVLQGLDGLLSHKLPAYPHPNMDQKENLLDQDLTLTVVLPGGVEKTTVVPGRWGTHFL